MKNVKTKAFEYYALMIISFIFFMVLLYLLTGKNCFSHNTYNTYAYQAEAWTKGKLDLDENYSWLEIAEYNGKYYCSFPPFPSFVLLPFAFIFGHNTPDAFILLVLNILTITYLYKTALYFNIKEELAVLSVFSVTVCTNFLVDIFDPAVWFFAQNMCFCFSCISIYYAIKNKGLLSLFFISAAVGARPMIAVFIPLILYILCRNEKETNGKFDLLLFIRRRINWFILPTLLAFIYMLLNYLRFGNVLEFGHNYLPEFMYEHKQFSTSYIISNLGSLLNVPGIDSNGKLIIEHFGRTSFLIVSPVIVYFFVLIVISLIKKDREYLNYILLIIISCGLYILFILCHATMGGWHFGNRYTNEILPFIFWGVILLLSKFEKAGKWQLPFAIWGISINMVGLIIVYNNLNY